MSQNDLLWGALTVRENLEMASKLYCADVSAEEREVLIDEVLDGFGLRVCEHNKVGNPVIKGISGGQKRKLSLGYAMLKRPSLMFLDEPTSGLDSKSASEVMKVITSMAKTLNVIVVCVVQQPSSRLFYDFDRVAVMCRGKIAYFGLAADAVRYFEDLGEKMPPNYNPCDFLLDVTNPDFIGEEKTADIIHSWEKHVANSPLTSSEASLVSLDLIDSDMTNTTYSNKTKRLPYLGQVSVLMQRACKIYLRDPGAFIGRAFFYIFLGTFFGVLYSNSKRQQDQLGDFGFLSVWGGMPTSYMCIVAIPLISTEAAIVQLECKNGMYFPTAYSLAIALASIPFVLLLISLYMIPLFFIPGLCLEKTRYFLYTFVMFCFGLVWEALGSLIGTLIPNFLISLCAFVGACSTLYVVNGFFLAPAQITWAFRWLHYISPHTYSWRAFSFLIYDGDVYDDYNGCKETGNVCFARNGSEYLEYLPGTDADDNVLECCLVLLLMATILRFGHAFLLHER